MRRGWRVASVAFLALFIGAIVQAWALSLRDALGPGPGFFPFWLGVIGAVLAIILFIQVRGWPHDDVSVLPERAARGRIAAVFVALVIATALMGPLGFRLTFLAFNAYVLLALGIRNTLAVSLFALAGSFGVFHVFDRWLQVPLPVGVLGI
jgi:putative tricarboxylic transport membrane protein